ncbi:unnamed protein product [Amoebophrya sp. A120]|nr:unnamed protein product [Amoebophrya sp. A120]|eukprot:GSA120T00020172001.1
MTDDRWCLRVRVDGPEKTNLRRRSARAQKQRYVYNSERYEAASKCTSTSVAAHRSAVGRRGPLSVALDYYIPSLSVSMLVPRRILDDLEARRNPRNTQEQFASMLFAGNFGSTC